LKGCHPYKTSCRKVLIPSEYWLDLMQQTNKPTMKPLNSQPTPAHAIILTSIGGRRVCDGDCGGNWNNKALKKSEESTINFPLVTS